MSQRLPLTLRPGIRPNVFLQRPRRSLPFPLDRSPGIPVPGEQIVPRAIAEAGLRAGDEVLVPALGDASLINGLLRGDLVCRFYEPGDTLESDEEELASLRGAGTRALVITDHLGFPRDAGRWRAWCDRHDLLLIEDCTQAWLATAEGRPVGALADVALFDLANTVPVPHAVAAVVGGRLRYESARRRVDAFLLHRLAQPAVAERRRANYRALLTAVEGVVPAPLAELPDTASPFALPLETPDARVAEARMAAAGVEARAVGSFPHRLVATGFPRADAWRKRLVALPVHQELRPDDLDRVAEAASGLCLGSPARRPNKLRLDALPSLEAVRAEWSELGERSGNLFATWEWHSTWWRHFGRGRRLAATACRNARETLVGILPMYMAAVRPGPLVRFLGHGPGDRLGPICLPTDRLRVGEAVRRAVRSRRWGSALVLGDQLPAEESWSSLLGGRVLAREGSPIMRTDARTWEEFLAGQSANLRQQLRRKERKLAREHELRYRLVEDPDDLSPALDALFALHSARWSEEGATGFARAEAFHRDFAAQALERGWLRLWLLELDGRPVAAWQGFRFAGADWYYQMGRDPDWERSSVGLVLLAHTIRDCIESGLGEYRFLRGGEAYKGRFATMDPGLETVGLGSGARGRSALLAAQAVRRVPAPVRQRLSRTES